MYVCLYNVMLRTDKEFHDTEESEDNESSLAVVPDRLGQVQHLSLSGRQRSSADETAGKKKRPKSSADETAGIKNRFYVLRTE
jgi:hypothetical protein